MKKLFFYLVLSSLFVACTSNMGEEEEKRKLSYAELIDKPTEITFEETTFDFGEVKDGDFVNHTFKFKNTGSNELILISVNGSCGCTVPEDWPKEPIKPGASGEIKVSFDSHNRVGNVKKSVRIEANTNPTVTTLNITGNVIAN